MAMNVSALLLVASEDPSTRELVTTLFRRAGFRTYDVASGEAALATVEEREPALILIDLKLEDMSGYELCYEVRQRFGSELPVILLSEDRTEPRDRVAGLLIGADDYLPKPFDPDELLARARRLLSRTATPQSPGDFTLTPRELEVLQLLAQGLGRGAMAEKLFLSPKTVATHVQHILTKLGVHSGTEAVAMAYRVGLVEQPSGAEKGSRPRPA
jgi:DNA-binding NarL/FixJ family response regulator